MKFIKKHFIIKSMWVRGWGHLAPSWAMMSAPSRVLEDDAKFVMKFFSKIAITNTAIMNL